jgi:hypothetical protein
MRGLRDKPALDADIGPDGAIRQKEPFLPY